MKEWLIMKNGYFYRPNRSGYTTHVIEAGLYTEKEARNIARIGSSEMQAFHASQAAVLIKQARENIARFGFIK